MLLIFQSLLAAALCPGVLLFPELLGLLQGCIGQLRDVGHAACHHVELFLYLALGFLLCGYLAACAPLGFHAVVLQVFLGSHDILSQHLRLVAARGVGFDKLAPCVDGTADVGLFVFSQINVAQYLRLFRKVMPLDACDKSLHLRQLLVVLVPLVGALGYEREDLLQSLYLLVERGLCDDAALVERFDNLLRVAVEVVQLLAALLDHLVQVALLLQVFGVGLADAALAGFGSVDGAL